MNEIQITTMLAKTVATDGEILPKEVQEELFLEKKQVDMTALQRQKGLLMIQMFFADLGDSNCLSIGDQLRVQKKIEENKRAEARAEALKKKKEREERKKLKEEKKKKKEEEDLTESDAEQKAESEEDNSEKECTRRTR